MENLKLHLILKPMLWYHVELIKFSLAISLTIAIGYLSDYNLGNPNKWNLLQNYKGTQIFPYILNNRYVFPKFQFNLKQIGYFDRLWLNCYRNCRKNSPKNLLKKRKILEKMWLYPYHYGTRLVKWNLLLQIHGGSRLTDWMILTSLGNPLQFLHSEASRSKSIE